MGNVLFSYDAKGNPVPYDDKDPDVVFDLVEFETEKENFIALEGDED